MESCTDKNQDGGRRAPPSRNWGIRVRCDPIRHEGSMRKGQGAECACELRLTCGWLAGLPPGAEGPSFLHPHLLLHIGAVLTQKSCKPWVLVVGVPSAVVRVPRRGSEAGR